MGMVESINFQFAQNMTFQNPVVKYHVNEIKFIANKDSFLSGLKTEAVSKFDNEVTQMVEQKRFEFLFLKQGSPLLRNVQELEKIIVFDSIGYSLWVYFLLDDGKRIFHITGQSDTFVTQRSYLTSELTDRKPSLDGEHLVIHALDGIVNLHQFRKVSERY